MCKFGLDKDFRWESEQIGRFDAFFPRVDSNGNETKCLKIPTYIKLKIDDKSHFLKTHIKNDRKGNIYIAPINYDGEKIEEIDFERASFYSFLYNKIIRDKNQRLMLLGLVIAIIGVIIDGGLALGKAGFSIFYMLSNKAILFWMVISIFFKIVGLTIVFFKGVQESK